MENIIDAKKLTLDEWLNLLNEHPDDTLFIDYMFPTDTHKNQYFNTINSRSDEEIDKLLRCFLWLPATFGSDETKIEYFLKYKIGKINRKMTELENRYLWNHITDGKIEVWDGIRWVLDLLPQAPGRCIEVLRSFLIAYGWRLPDGRFYGVLDAMDLIRKRYIAIERDGKEFLHIDDRDMEKLVSKLYEKMGYQIELTQPIKDGGYDVLIIMTVSGRREKSLVEVKHHTKPIGVTVVRQLLGLVSTNHANKGILVITSKFTCGAKELAEKDLRVELINGQMLLHLLNEYLGSDWKNRLYRIIESKKFSVVDVSSDIKK